MIDGAVPTDAALPDEMSIVVNGETVLARRNTRADASWDVTDPSGVIGTVTRSHAYDPALRHRLIVRRAGQRAAVVVEGLDAALHYLAGSDPGWCSLTPLNRNPPVFPKSAR